jgi:hypothetical protein
LFADRVDGRLVSSKIRIKFARCPAPLSQVFLFWKGRPLLCACLQEDSAPLDIRMYADSIAECRLFRKPFLLLQGPADLCKAETLVEITVPSILQMLSRLPRGSVYVFCRNTEDFFISLRNLYVDYQIKTNLYVIGKESRLTGGNAQNYGPNGQLE